MATVTLGFTVHGEPKDWTVQVTGPGSMSSERTSTDATGYGLLDEMLTEMFDAACRCYPQRVPTHLRTAAK